MADDFDPSERVRVRVDHDKEARDLTIWTACEISRGLDRGASAFSVAVGRGKLKDAGIGALPVAEFDAAQVLIGEDLVLTGWVDKVKRSRTAEAHGVSIQGRSVTADLIDCAAANSPGQWGGSTLLRIVQDLARGPGPGSDRRFNIPVVADAAARAVVPNFELEQGESVFDAIERAARFRGLIVHDGPTGALHVVRPGLRRAEVTLRHRDGPDGEPDPDNNVLESEVTVDASKRFSEVVVKGQKEGGLAKAGAKGSAADRGVPRFRPLIVAAEGQATDGDAVERARWEVARRAGKALQMTHSVRGWRQTPGGALWDVDLVVPVEDDQAGVYRDMLVVDVKWALDDKGRRSVLTLEPPEAWHPQPFVDTHTKWASVAAAVRG
ncbi:MAG: hypothetical protein IH626_06205 [Rhodospirillales bacterium]|nr:hypothetical protein [Rhodospirillales bacterium]